MNDNLQIGQTVKLIHKQGRWLITGFSTFQGIPEVEIMRVNRNGVAVDWNGRGCKYKTVPAIMVERI